MNEIYFRKFLISKKYSKKLCSDFISRIKRLENTIENCDVDNEYDKDRCKKTLSLLENNGDNEELKKVLIGPLPVGKYSMSTFRYSLKKYIEYRDALNQGFEFK